SRFDVRIELASASTDNEERDAMLVGPEFFNAGTRPEARYVATAFRALGGDRYVAEGELTLNGVTRKVPLTFRWQPGATTVLEGEATLARLAFKVGEGDWADTGLLPDEVKVRTRLELTAK
ncbi:YceI family protein, partial [Arenimonas sp.]|uniref:YceI family protein n=1 Tax=Arenimonas sp. TaxID=1872635 RepID=UPI0025DAAE0A